MIDRDQLREALDRLESLSPSFREPVVEEAARLVASEDTLVISKVDGEWDRRTIDVMIGALSDSRIRRSQVADALDALLEGQPK